MRLQRDLVTAIGDGVTGETCANTAPVRKDFIFWHDRADGDGGRAAIA